MKTLKFKNYNNGFVQAYFTHDKILYCIQPHLGIELLFCSRDGEPSHPVKDPNDYNFTGLDNKTWSWTEILEQFSNCKSGRDFCCRMTEFFGEK